MRITLPARLCAAVVLTLALLTPALAGNKDKAAKPDAARAKKSFDLLKKLEGKWAGKSEYGEEISIFRIISGGTAIQHEMHHKSPTGAQEIMTNMFHLDDGALLMTHYCASGNQPRLQAVSISDDGKEVFFRFRDGTNLGASKEIMDSVRIRFIDGDNLVMTWGSAEKGKASQQMSDFVYKRVKT